jgi:pyruvate/2-oxoglutarate dehydrogenase complex dihydrolipoamide acyltransferase (E2) component
VVGHYTAFPKARSHVYYFMRQARRVAPIQMVAPVDMTRVRQAQARYRERGVHMSVSTFVVKAAGLAYRKYPEANVLVRRSLVRPRVYHPEAVNCLVLFDKRVGGGAAVVSGRIREPDRMDLAGIQDIVDHYRATPYEDNDGLRDMRMLHRLPFWLGRIVYRLATLGPRRRAEVEGTFTFTRLNAPRVTEGYPQINTSVSLVGFAIVDTPVVRDGRVVVRPVMRLVLAFDHDAMDGTLAARLLDETCRILEDWNVQ